MISFTDRDVVYNKVLSIGIRMGDQAEAEAELPEPVLFENKDHSFWAFLGKFD